MKTITLKKAVLPEWATLEYDNGITSFESSNLKLRLEPEQENSYVSGTVLRERLSNEGSANLAVLQYFAAHPKELPNEWRGRYIYGWGTIVRDRNGHLRAPYLCENDGLVELDWRWLVDFWRRISPALRFANLHSVPRTSEQHSEPLNLELSEIRVNGKLYRVVEE